MSGRPMTRVAVLLALLAFPSSRVLAQPALTVVGAGPTGEVSSLAQANEIRVTFSEPMVELGRVPDEVKAPFFTIRPAVTGTFRWSGTALLIFTPDPDQPLPYATRYEVTIGTGATAVSGRRLARPYTFTFTTPTVRLLRTQHYRRGDRFDGQVVIGLRFNQPVRPQDVVNHVVVRYETHEWKPPVLAPQTEARLAALDPAGLQRFRAKVAETSRVAALDVRVTAAVASDWDQRRWDFAPAPDLVVVEVIETIASESRLRVELDPTLPAVQGTAVPHRTQTSSFALEPAFFVDGFHCESQCNPDAYNKVGLRRSVKADVLFGALSITDVTDPRRPVPVPAPPADELRQRITSRYGLVSELFGASLEEAGYDAQPPARTFEVRIDGSLQATDGQTLGYPWVATVENWHRTAFSRFEDGHGVWESSGSPVLPFVARNLRDVVQFAKRVEPAELMPRIQALLRADFATYPAGEGAERPLPVTPDRIDAHGLDLAPALGSSPTGLVWAAVKEGEPIERAKPSTPRRERSTLVQVTNLGITVKDSPQNTLVFVTRLDTGEPVAGATVSIIRTDNRTFWTGTTGPDGVSIAPDTPLRPHDWYQRLGFHFIVLAEKDGDIAYAASDWHQGIDPRSFGLPFNLDEADPILRGTIFTDRGVYRLGEEVHFKAIARRDTPEGMELWPKDTPLSVTVLNSQDEEVDARVMALNEWSAAEWTWTLPADAPLGTYRVSWHVAGASHGTGETASFLVAAYRRPTFRVDATLAGDPAVAGSPLEGVVSARYLFGAPMGGRPVAWRVWRTALCGPPAAVTRNVSDDRFAFGVGCGWGQREVASADATLGDDGRFTTTIPTDDRQGVAYQYTIEGDVEDVSRQHLAGRASLVVHPAPWYIGVLTPSYFVDQAQGLDTAIVAVSTDGEIVPGVTVEIASSQWQWHSVQRAEGQGGATWETERRQVESGTWTVTTADTPVPLSIGFTTGGYFELTATATDEAGHVAQTRTRFFVVGPGYTAWERYNHNRITLVPERQTYRPGDTARIMIQSPWETATALVTTEREGVRSHRQFALTSTQQTISLPVTEADIPNVFVSVLLVRGRTQTEVDADGADPGKPSMRLGYAELKVEDRVKRLSVAVDADREEYRPKTTARVEVAVTDVDNRPVESEVTVWAVDYGVLSLTAYRTPDLLGSIYLDKALEVVTTDNRQQIVSRRVLVPKGAAGGGGGGGDAGVDGTVRKDFRVLAFWLGSVVTDASGRARLDVELPESLTTYRIMAVAGDRRSRFGWGESEIRVSKPVTLTAAFPRFMAVGDRALFGSVVTNQLAVGGPAIVTMRSLDPDVLDIRGNGRQTIDMAARASAEVRFETTAKAVGRARIRTTVQLGDEGDAFEDTLPVEILASPETVAAYGQAAPEARETLVIPRGVVPGFGGFHVELASTALVGLGEGARYLVEYPYGCAEQRGSRALALLLTADLGDAFSLPGIEPAGLRSTVQATLKDLERFQCSSGGFAYWAGECQSVSPYLTAYLLHVFQVATSLGYAVDTRMRDRAFGYLQAKLSEPPPLNDGWWPAYTAWQAFAVKVLVEGGRGQDSNLTRLYGHRDRMPVFGLAYLHDAMMAAGETGDRVDDLRRRMMNAILPEGGSAHVEELNDPYLLWFWNSNVRSTSIAMSSLMRGSDADAMVGQLVRWLLAVRKNGRWGNTQENAHALEALVSYYKKYEAEIPAFDAVVKLGREELARERFEGRSSEAAVTDVPMAALVAKARPGSKRDISFSRQGTGTLFYAVRLRYAADELFQDGLDAGFHIRRTYAPYRENEGGEPAVSYQAGDLIKVTLTFELTKERRFVAVTDPLPAGFEPIESWFATTAADLAGAQQELEDQGTWWNWWERGGFDHVERHDDRVLLFATRLAEGHHEFSYVVRATTAGTFRTAPAHAEEMYEPEVFGRTGTAVIDVRR